MIGTMPVSKGAARSHRASVTARWWGQGTRSSTNNGMGRAAVLWIQKRAHVHSSIHIHRIFYTTKTHLSNSYIECLSGFVLEPPRKMKSEAKKDTEVIIIKTIWKIFISSELFISDGLIFVCTRLHCRASSDLISLCLFVKLHNLIKCNMGLTTTTQKDSSS